MKPDIDILLDKYWEAETSANEEDILKAYFNSEDVDRHHLVFKPLFETFNVQSSTLWDYHQDIDVLLEKYWNAETDEYEELFIKNHFSLSQNSADNENINVLFDYFNFNKNIKVSTDLSIDSLIEKYWEGETSLEQEKMLQEYFNSEYLSPQHEQFKDYFQYCVLQQNVILNSFNKSEVDASNTTTQESKTFKVLPFRKWAYAAAAVFVLGLSSLFVVQQMNSKESAPSLVHEIEDPEEAYRVTMEALAMLSYKYKKSEDAFMDNISHLNAVNILSN